MSSFANRVRSVLSRRDNSGLEIIAEKVSGATQAYRVSKDDDIFAVINDALENAGQDGYVTVENGRYIRSNGTATSTQMVSKYDGQQVDFQNSRVELADNSGLSSMINIQHDSFTIATAHLLGNRNNNSSITDVIDGSGSLKEPVLDNVEVSGAPNGILMNSTTGGQIINSGAPSYNQNLDTAIHVVSCENIDIVNARLRGFTSEALVLDNCDSIDVSALGIKPISGVSASNAIHIRGTRDSSIKGTIDAQGEVDKGILDEAYDVGRSNQRYSNANVFAMSVNGVNDIGFHISDGQKERVRGIVDGHKPNGRTTQAFLVDSPNNIVNPQHNINLDGIHLTRISNTQQTGTNAGMKIAGHHSQINQTSTIGIGGNSILELRFGQSIPTPAVVALSGTNVHDQKPAKRNKTDTNGQVSIDWSNFYIYEDKPILNVELEQAGEWYVSSWVTNSNGRYTGANIQVTDSSGTAVGNNVNVNAKVLGA